MRSLAAAVPVLVLGSRSKKAGRSGESIERARGTGNGNGAQREDVEKRRAVDPGLSPRPLLIGRRGWKESPGS